MSGKSKRGFASMDAARQREIASKGGRAAHAKGTAHEWSSDEARVAGRKGGEVVSRDRAHMAAIGREGGESRGQKAAREREHSRSVTEQRAIGDQVSRYADRESRVELSREGVGGIGDGRPRDELREPPLRSGSVARSA
jgi:general stress protein YciG